MKKNKTVLFIGTLLTRLVGYGSFALLGVFSIKLFLAAYPLVDVVLFRMGADSSMVNGVLTGLIWFTTSAGASALLAIGISASVQRVWKHVLLSTGEAAQSPGRSTLSPVTLPLPVNEVAHK